VADPAPHRASDSSDSTHQRETLVETAELLAKILDTSLKIPGTPLSVGLDPLLGLIPGVGDMLANLIGTAILVLAARLHVPEIVLPRMSLNLLINGAVAPFPLSATSSPSGLRVTLEMPSCCGVLQHSPIGNHGRPGSIWSASSGEPSCFSCSPLEQCCGSSYTSGMPLPNRDGLSFHPYLSDPAFLARCASAIIHVRLSF
jgi:Domain of unknown function (DUF4112)